jgi:hypothetical protein
MKKHVQKLTKLSKKIFLLFFVSLLLLSEMALAQEEKEFNFSVALNSDQFFGFYPTFQGSYGFSDKAQLTFYGIHWGGGSGAAWGNWTEFGIGANFNAGDGITINPQIGFLGGSLLSSGTAGPAIFGDGIVPNLTVNLLKEKIEGQFYYGYYAALRDEAPLNGTTLAYTHYWINLGFRANKFFSLGAHYEHLINSGGSNVAEATDVYQWLGPYIQFSKPTGGPFARFSFGTDLVEGNNSFFKLTTGFSF